jgi:hypothetical protein
VLPARLLQSTEPASCRCHASNQQGARRTAFRQHSSDPWANVTRLLQHDDDSRSSISAVPVIFQERQRMSLQAGWAQVMCAGVCLQSRACISRGEFFVIRSCRSPAKTSSTLTESVHSATWMQKPHRQPRDHIWLGGSSQTELLGGTAILLVTRERCLTAAARLSLRRPSHARLRAYTLIRPIW